MACTYSEWWFAQERSYQLVKTTNLQPLSCIPPSATRGLSVLQLRLAQLERRRQDLDRAVEVPLAAIHLPEVLRLHQIRTHVHNRGVSSHKSFQHIHVLTKFEALVHLAEAFLDRFGLLTKAIEPDVVLGQADVDVEGLVFFSAGEQGLDDCCGSY